MRIVFMGTPDFAVPTLSEIVGQGHEVVAVYTRAPAPGGRGMAERPSPVHTLAVEPRSSGSASAIAAQRRGAHDVQGTRGGSRRCRGLWHDPAAVHPRCAVAGMREPAWIVAAALARRGAAPARRDGRGRRGGRRRDAHGGRARYGAGRDGGTHRAQARYDGRRPPRRTGPDRRRPHGPGRRCHRPRHVAVSPATRARRDLRAEDRQSRVPDRLEPAGDSGRPPDHGPVAFSGCLLRGRSRPGSRAHQGAPRARGRWGRADRERCSTMRC